MGKLQLDTREGVEQGGSRGPVIVSGQPDQSILIEALQYTNANLPNAARWQAARLGYR